MVKIRGNKVDIATVRNYSKCGGYNGNGMFSGVETIFGIYLDVIEKSCNVIAKTNEFGPDDKEQVGALQKEIDMVVEELTKYAERCIDKNNLEINYDHKDFLKKFEDKPNIADNFAAMSYFIAFVAWQKGYGLFKEDDVLRARSNDLEGVKLQKCAPLTIEQLRNLVYQTRAYNGQRE